MSTTALLGLFIVLIVAVAVAIAYITYKRDVLNAKMSLTTKLDDNTAKTSVKSMLKGDAFEQVYTNTFGAKGKGHKVLGLRGFATYRKVKAAMEDYFDSVESVYDDTSESVFVITREGEKAVICFSRQGKDGSVIEHTQLGTQEDECDTACVAGIKTKISGWLEEFEEKPKYQTGTCGYYNVSATQMGMRANRNVLTVGKTPVGVFNQCYPKITFTMTDDAGKKTNYAIPATAMVNYMVTLADKQQNSIIKGGPGTGKTEMLKYMIAEHGENYVFMWLDYTQMSLIARDKGGFTQIVNNFQKPVILIIDETKLVLKDDFTATLLKEMMSGSLGSTSKFGVILSISTLYTDDDSLMSELERAGRAKLVLDFDVLEPRQAQKLVDKIQTEIPSLKFHPERFKQLLPKTLTLANIWACFEDNTLELETEKLFAPYKQSGGPKPATGIQSLDLT